MGPERLIGSCPLFAGLEPAALAGLAAALEPAAFEPGEAIMRQGQAAEGAFIIESGKAGVITALPGGGEAEIAEAGPGTVLGEMALLERGVRSATVIARTPVRGCFIERESFRLLLVQRNRAAFTVQHRITLELCRRLRALNAKVVAHSELEGGAPAAAQAPAAPPQRGRCSFDYRAFLPALPIFRRFSAADIGELAALAEVLEVGRGQPLFGAGEEGRACYLVVRGALELCGERDGRRHRVAILGPGRLCGVLALIEGRQHSMGAAARENSTLLEIGKQAFDRLSLGSDRLAAKFQEAINCELLQALARTNNSLTRLISQARIRGGRRGRQAAEELQRALTEQDCRAA
ncbi:MAG TPA: cyclic nucleotide-binding domain-containing protein [Burkholderiales bacterium]|nr:cyclic nucleotide-binding domain-containing protein [Burkholderiales bacterium]